MTLLMTSCVCACTDEFLWPTSDVTTSNWSDSAGGDGDGAMWDEIDEVQSSSDSPDDATTYVDTTTNASALECHLSDPVGTGHVTARMNVRTRKDIDFDALDIELYEGATQIHLSAIAISPLATWVTLQTSAFSITGVTDMTDLRMRVTNRGTEAGTVQVSTMWLELICG